LRGAAQCRQAGAVAADRCHCAAPTLVSCSDNFFDEEHTMKVFVAGATGAVGRRLIPALVASGHEVVGMTRSDAKSDALRALGAEPVVADGLDPRAVMKAVTRARPEVVVHQMTGLTSAKSFKKFDKEFALTNRLRTEGLDHLIEAAQAAGARRLVAQSYGNWNYERIGSAPKTEDDPLDPDPPANQRESLAAIRRLERAVGGAGGLEGIALRFGNFYGPGTGFALDGDLVELVHKRRLPIVGDGAGVWSFIHVDDVATATIAALDHGSPGIYNIVDDEPAPVSDWLPDLAEAIGAKPPRHVPVWLGRIATGEVGVSMMTRIKGASNAKAKRALDWAPAYGSWRQGFRVGLGDGPPPGAASRSAAA
jgi:nucleoside-diphosphate-sugar epimerase